MVAQTVIYNWTALNLLQQEDGRLSYEVYVCCKGTLEESKRTDLAAISPTRGFLPYKGICSVLSCHAIAHVLHEVSALTGCRNFTIVIENPRVIEGSCNDK